MNEKEQSPIVLYFYIVLIIWLVMVAKQIFYWMKNGEWMKITLYDLLELRFDAGNMLGVQKLYDWICFELPLTLTVFVVLVVIILIIKDT